MATIGFGDFIPKTTFSKIFFGIWFIISLILMGIYLINTKEVVTELLTEKYKKELKKIEKKRKILDEKIMNNHIRLNSEASVKRKLTDYVYEWYYHSMLVPSGLKIKKVPNRVSTYIQTEVGDADALNKRLSRAGFTNKSIEDIQKSSEERTKKMNIRRMNFRMLFATCLNIVFV
ncbi:hypothetical protein AYI68_g7463 [Smittium mucronatum]|uniref:Potassium channel domain-containing protein n=1 Tax=Smittium mucronatum TaxID=133383 RepID=A0A1R0GNN7_9FUNG|nr:hypothetical protein AYI68_g7463 [Smittium mucronatum]